MARKRFAFRLQRLLKVREIRERQAQQELVRRRIVLQQREAELAQLHAQADEMARKLETRPGETIDLHERLTTEYFLRRKHQEIELFQPKVDQARRDVEEQVPVVTKTGIDVKVLEKLEEKQREEFREETLRDEAIFLDDIAGQQYIRNEGNAR